MDHFNKLTPAEAERLALLVEEMGESIQAIGKVLRHGYESHHPRGGASNRETLERELGDVLHAMQLIAPPNGDPHKHDLAWCNIKDWAASKADEVAAYLHHQNKAR